MGLTGFALTGLVLAATLAAFVGAVVVLPRLSGRGVRAVLGRVGVLVVVSALCLLTAAVSLNDRYTFYADWADLRGGMFGHDVTALKMAGGSAKEAAQASVPGRSVPAPRPGRPLPPLPAGAGSARVLRFMVKGSLSGLQGTVLVTLPKGYTDPANATMRYPVLEAFHGYPGGPSQWVEGMNLDGNVDRAVARGTMGQAITISPATEFPPGMDTECVDGGGTLPKVETWLAKDVPAWAVQTLRVRTDRASWATIGLSEGGWCAAMATMLHPDQYAAAIVMGGYFAPEFSRRYAPFPPQSPQASRYDLIQLAQAAPPPVAMWTETSHADPVSYPSTSRLLQAAQPPMAVQALVLVHAGHRTSVWQAELPQALDWLGTNVPGFAP